MRRRAAWLVPALAVVLTISGCAQAETDVTAESSAHLQSLVVSVAETAATGDYSAAMAELDALQAALDAARGQGDVSDERAASIQVAIDVVRADLLQAVEPETPSAPVEETVETPVSEAPADPKPEKTKDGGPGRGNGGDGNSGNGNSGNGVGSGNSGNGKSG